jgi:tetratricopeptide (TPR) repeat protein
MELDSTFLLAAWRLGNVRRWMPLRSAPPYPPGFFELYQRRPEALPEADRYLIEAQFRPSGGPRFERYEDALRVAGDDPYAALLYGDELFHRGPLAGRPLSDAIAMLQRAVAMDSTLAPAWEHLAWAWIRAGDAERAREALGRLERLAGHPEESEIYLPMFLRLAYEARFGTRDDAVRAQQALRGSPGALAIAARGAMSFDLPLVQVALGEALAASGETADLRASGFTARGVALFALGRPRAALAAFDSAALRFERPAEARLQAAEWRVVPAALGVSGIDPRERAAGLAMLRALAEDSLAGPRAAWALALDAAARGDTVALGDWAARVQLPPSRGERLVPLLEGVAHAARGRWEDALAASAPGLAQDSAGYAPDPFFRAALHLLRGEWLTRLDRAAEADRAWLWYESLDVSRWPSAEAQAAEVDWALSTHARWRRARLAMVEGKTTVSCLMGRRVAEIWSAAEPSAVPSDQVENLTFRCPV